MDISIIIVSWNVKEKLRDNLRALYESKHINFEVFVVDNNSSDGTVAMVKSLYPQVKLIVNQKNLGFAKANNQAIKQASGDYLLLLNPDMRVFDDTLCSMFSWMQRHEQAWVAGCKLIDEHGQNINQVRRFPALSDQLAIVLKIPHFFPSTLGDYIIKDFNYDKSMPVDSIRGGFFIIKKQAVEKVGLLDERFFLWFEEVDYCQRVKRAGGQVWYTSAAECIDYVGQSFKQVNVMERQKYFRDSMLKYFKKWRPAYEYWILKIAWPFGLMLVWIGEAAGFKNKAKT